MLCSNSLSHGYSLFERIMGYMLSVLHAVDHEVVKIVEFLELFFRNIVHVGAVGYVSETIS